MHTNKDNQAINRDCQCWAQKILIHWRIYLEGSNHPNKIYFNRAFVITYSFHILINVSPFQESSIPSLIFISSMAYQYLQFAYLLLNGGQELQRDRMLQWIVLQMWASGLSWLVIWGWYKEGNMSQYRSRVSGSHFWGSLWAICKHAGYFSKES